MCVDFTDLNKACPKDAYPLPNIDKLVDNASGFQSLSFMDAYSGYNQILMHPEDQNKTAFITEHGNFCYRVMPFGLKNAGETYPRLMDKVFHHQIGRNMEIYVDNMVAKTTQEKSHCDDLKEIFKQIRAYNMRLNLEKCAFGVQGGIMPRDKGNPQNFTRKASLYTNIAGELYRRGFSQPLLKCLSKDEAHEVMNEVHEGVCGNHIGGRALAAKIIRTGSVEHPQTNGQAEAANRVILQALKKMLDSAKGEWAELIPEVLWSYNTTIQTTTGETPFKLVYGSEALIPIEVGTPTLRTDLYDEQRNISARNAELDLVEEDREIAAIKQRAQKQLVERRHNKKVVPRIFEEGDLVLRRTEEARQPLSHGKLAKNWEGPFRVSRVLRMGAYQLQTLQGNPMSGNWNISSLKLYRS
ncbi:uncharacterized protein [Arachis hypogaea]|uniref:uncharacterized protein n=1 Tax=Arachis hypogaea TaxID=3818 RepID=UPI003B20D447